MEQFLEEVRTYAAATGLSPSTVIQRANCGGGTTWAKWVAGRGSPTLRTVDRIRIWMKENPPSVADGVREDAA